MGSRSRFTDGNIQFWDDKYHAAASAGVWATCPLAAFNGDPSIAYVYDSNWASFQAAEAATTTLAGYTVTNATSGSATMPDSAGGVLQLNSLADTAARGVQVQKNTFNFFPKVDKPIWYETEIVTDNLVAEMFYGMSISDTTIINGSANTSTDHIGWQCVTDDGVLLFSAEKAGTGATKASTTMVADTNLRLGFKVSNASATTLKIEHWVNDAKQSTTHVNANVSVLALGPSWVAQGGGTGRVVARNFWTKIVQIR